jgi:hypothetical protein
MRSEHPEIGDRHFFWFIFSSEQGQETSGGIGRHPEGHVPPDHFEGAIGPGGLPALPDNNYG